MKPRINLCVFNHPRMGILDQIWFAEEVFAQNGYELICTNILRQDCLNLLIENFVEHDVNGIETFCQTFHKKIGIVMTEHIELNARGFSFNGAPLLDIEYVGNKEQRLFSLLSLADCAFGFFTFGELPELRSWGDILPSHQVHRLPYPSIRNALHRPMRRRDYDIVFTGVLTAQRKSVLNTIGAKYCVVSSELQETEGERTRLYAGAKIAVNIPQSKNWAWVSPMRILFGLRIGVPTVHLGRRDTTMFSKLVCEAIELADAVRDYEALFQRQFNSYEGLVRSRHNSPFPSAVFNTWGELELLC